MAHSWKQNKAITRLKLRTEDLLRIAGETICCLKRGLAILLVCGVMASLIPTSRAAEILAAGTRLEVRLSLPTGSRISHPGDPIKALVIAPVFESGRLLVPQGAIISGTIQSVYRVGLGLKRLTSGIEYRFDTMELPAGKPIPIEARVVEVETAKERVNAEGLIGGISPTANLSSSVAFYTLPLLCLDPALGVPLWGVKVLIARSPDPEIYFPAGTELILQLTGETDIPSFRTMPDAIEPLTGTDMARADRILAELPQQRTERLGNHPSDWVNMLFLGSRESIDRAFQAAGWAGAQRHSLLTIYRMYHCMVQRMGYRTAPMGHLTLNGATADAEYQKSLNTFSKRHHLRLWKQGREDAWVSAATEDVGYRVRRMHLTHGTDPLIDNERAKVLNDLAFTGCVESGALIKRESPGPADQKQRSLSTDGKIAVVRINDCQNPRTMPGETANRGALRRSKSVQAAVALRNDLIRANPISFGSNTIRRLRAHQDSLIKGLHSTEEGITIGWIRPSVLDATASADGRDTLSRESAEKSQVPQN